MVPLRALILEDNPSDALLILHELRRSGYDIIDDRVETEQDYCDHLQLNPEIILADFTLPEFDALRALEILRDSQLDIPLIVVSGNIGEERAVQVMQGGASDYIVKDRLGRLGQAVAQALDKQKAGRVSQLCARRLVVQHSITQGLANSPTLAESNILKIICNSLSWDFGALWLVDTTEKELRCFDSWQNPLLQTGGLKFLTRQQVLAHGNELPERAWVSDEACWTAIGVPDADTSRMSHAASAGLRAAFAFPIILGSETLGILEFFGREFQQPDSEMLKLMKDVGSQLAQFINRERAESSLRQSNQTLMASNQDKQEQVEELEHLYRLAPVGLALMDRDYSLLRINERLAVVAGKPVGEQIGHTLGEIMPELAPEMTAVVDRVFASGEPVIDVEFRSVHSADSKVARNWHMSSYPVKSDGITRRVGIVVQEITERKRVEVDLRLAKEAADAGSRSKSEFLANMSHEIRTPLNGILGMTQLTLNSDLSREQRENLEMVKSSADSLLQVINDILDFSKIEAGRLEIDVTPFALRESLASTVKLLGLRAYQNGLELICHIGAQVPDQVVGDSLRIRQVVTNLIGNAVKFTKRGEIVLHVEFEGGRREQSGCTSPSATPGLAFPPTNNKPYSRPSPRETPRPHAVLAAQDWDSQLPPNWSL